MQSPTRGRKSHVDRQYARISRGAWRRRVRGVQCGGNQIRAGGYESAGPEPRDRPLEMTEFPAPNGPVPRANGATS